MELLASDAWTHISMVGTLEEVSMHMHRTAAYAVLVGMVGFGPLLGAQPPARIDQVPVHAGATRHAEREAEMMSPSDEAGMYGDRALRLSTVRVYRVPAPIEAVARFYQQRLAAREIADGDWEPVYRDDIPAGRASPLLCELMPVDFSQTDDPAGLQGAYAKKRPPFRPELWLAGADFRWTHQDTGTRRTEFNLSLEDIEAFEIVTPEYHHETEIVIWARTWEAGEGAEPEPMDELAPAEPMPPPTEAQLEAPLYPGARFEGTISAEMSASDEEAWYYVFASTDPYEKVAAFYRERTGKQGLENEGGLLIVLRGEGLFPDLGVTVQPNVGTFAPPARTMITVRKRR
jgi:hypothetical protein